MGRLGFVALLALSLWVEPAAATVCLTCETVTCELVVETVTDCQIIPSNHELIMRATCPELVELEALPRIRRATGEVVPGEWERIGSEHLYRFVGARFPEGEELHLVGKAPQHCYVADVPACTSSQLACLSDALEPKDCCALYEEAAQTSWEDGQDGPSQGEGGQGGGGQGKGGQGGDGQGKGGQGGSTGSRTDEPIWLRFFASARDETPPDPPLVQPVCTDDGIGTPKLYLNGPGSFDDIQQLQIYAEGEDGAAASPSGTGRTPCLDAPWLGWGYIDRGVYRLLMEYRDWSGNITRTERSFRVPEDCVQTLSLDGRFACEKPTYPIDQACLERPLSGAPNTPDGTPDLCDRYYAEQEQDDELLLLDIDLGEPPKTSPTAATGGAPGLEGPASAKARSGCACTAAGRSTPGSPPRGALLAAFCSALLLARHRRPSLR